MSFLLPVNVQLAVVGKIVVDDQRHLLDIQTTSPNVRGDQHAAISSTELLHNLITLALLHGAMHSAHGEGSLTQGVGKPLHLRARIAEHDGLRDRKTVVEVVQSVELPLLTLHIHEELADALQGKLITLDEDLHRLVHELAGQVEHFLGHGGGQKHHLSAWGQIAVDVVESVLEALVEHLITLIDHQHLDVAGAEVSLGDHIEHTAGSSRDHLHTIIQTTNVLSHALSSDAGVTLDLHVSTDGDKDLLGLFGQLTSGREDQGLGLHQRGINVLQNTNAEHSGLSSSGLRLSNHVTSLNDRENGTLLNSRGLFKS